VVDAGENMQCRDGVRRLEFGWCAEEEKVNDERDEDMDMCGTLDLHLMAIKSNR
jgi:hypothetical protein